MTLLPSLLAAGDEVMAYPGAQPSPLALRSPSALADLSSSVGDAGLGWGPLRLCSQARARRHWPLFQVSSFPSFYAQSETDPFSSFSGLSPSFSAVALGGCLVASHTEPRGQAVQMPLHTLPGGKEQDLEELGQWNLGGSAHQFSCVFST